MSWVKVDDLFPQHPKVLSVGPLGIAAFVSGLCYCGRYLTDGFIPRAAVATLCDFTGIGITTATAMDGMVEFGEDVTAEYVADLLVEAGLWEEVHGGYQVHDYLVYNPSKAEVLAVKNARAEAGAKGGKKSAQIRAKSKPEIEQTESNGSSKNEATAQAKTKQNSTPSPSPYPEDISNTQQQQQGGVGGEASEHAAAAEDSPKGVESLSDQALLEQARIDYPPEDFPDLWERIDDRLKRAKHNPPRYVRRCILEQYERNPPGPSPRSGKSANGQKAGRAAPEEPPAYREFFVPPEAYERDRLRWAEMDAKKPARMPSNAESREFFLSGKVPPDVEDKSIPS